METHTPTHTPRHHGAAMSQIRGIDQQIAQTQTGSHGLYSHGLLILVLRKESVASLIVASAIGHRATQGDILKMADMFSNQQFSVWGFDTGLGQLH